MRYSGQFIDKNRGPKGTLDFGDGFVYSGEFVDGVISGKGWLLHRLKCQLYDGFWVDGEMEG